MTMLQSQPTILSQEHGDTRHMYQHIQYTIKIIPGGFIPCGDSIVQLNKLQRSAPAPGISRISTYNGIWSKEV